MKNFKKIHFVGIKGVGMTPLAIIAREAGIVVSGCDLAEEFITDESLRKANIEVLEGFDSSHIKNCDLIITTGAHGGYDNPEVIAAKNSAIPVLAQGQALGKFMNGEILGRSFEGISVSGSHGKTTISAMIATILKENNFDPTYLIGTGSVLSLGVPGHFGKGKYFVAEADEYATEPKYDKTPKLLWQRPVIGIITNIEFDHPDVYNSLDDLRNAFLKFANNIPSYGSLITCADDPEVRKLLSEYKGKTITYGFSKNNDFYVDKISIETDKMFFWVYAKDTLLGEFNLNVTGEHNAQNALCAIVTCLELGLSLEKIKKGLSAFKGSKRRFELVGKLNSGAVVYDDYAHHPTEIRNSLRALKRTFPNKKIVCIFQLHTFSRTKKLFEQFINSFEDAEVIILPDIFPSQREAHDNTVSSLLLSQAMAKTHKQVLYIAKLEDVIKYVEQKGFDGNYVIITMGAGDVYKVGKELIK